MRNWEKYEKFLKNVGALDIGKVDGKLVRCNSISCDDCDFNDPDCPRCDKALIDFLYKEYKPLDDFTKELLIRCYKKGYRYIGKDKSKTVYAYKGKPRKENVEWFCAGHIGPWCNLSVFDNFDFLSWKDEEPTAIKDLIGVRDE